MRRGIKYICVRCSALNRSSGSRSLVSATTTLVRASTPSSRASTLEALTKFAANRSSHSQKTSEKFPSKWEIAANSPNQFKSSNYAIGAVVLKAVQVILCRVRPKDNDVHFTDVATNEMKMLLCQEKKELVGHINLAMRKSPSSTHSLLILPWRHSNI